MSEDPIRQYSEATKEFNEAYSKIREYGMLLADVAWCLNNKPYDLGISNAAIKLPYEITKTNKRTTLDVESWVSADQIAEALANLYDKREKVKMAWNSLSSTDRGLVSPPDTKDK